MDQEELTRGRVLVTMDFVVTGNAFYVERVADRLRVLRCSTWYQ